MVATIKDIFICPDCKQPVTEHHKDDLQVQWYACSNGHQTTKPLIKHPDENLDKLYCPQCQMPTVKQETGLFKCRWSHETQTALTEPEYRAFIKGKASQAKTQRETEEKTNEEKKGERESQADRIYKIFCETTNIELFHDQNKICYARIPINVEELNATNAINDFLTTNITPNKDQKIEADTRISCKTSVDSVNSVFCRRIIRLESEEFKDYLSHLLFVSEGKIANSEAKTQVISLLKYDATQGKQYHLFNRVAPDPTGDGSIWLDTADKLSRAYHITKQGWTLENSVPILFRREEHQKPLTQAINNGNLELLLPFMNIGAGKDTEITKHRLLLLKVQTASYLIPEIPHPINAMFGCPGSHKSCTQRYIRSVVDPSAAPLLRIPRDENAALQVLDHHYIPVFDQIFYMPQWFSDMLCSAVTGAGQESRALYTNDQPFIRSFRRCILLNGVNIPATKGDLLSRGILHPTEPQEQRLTEKELDEAYSKALPSILGGFLDVIVKALNYYGTPEAKSYKVYRMADFTEWGCAIALALGEKVEDFIKAMDENLESQTSSDIENNNVAEAFLAYFGNDVRFFSYTEDEPFRTTPTDVFQKVEAKASELGTNIKNTKKWPSITSAFTRKLNDSKNAIISYGWNYDIFHDGKSRIMTVWRIQSEKPETAEIKLKDPIAPNQSQLNVKTEDSGLKTIEVKEIVHFIQLSDSDPDTQKCGRCQGVQAKVKLNSNIAGIRYACKTCFDTYRQAVEKQGVKFVDDTMPDYSEERSE